MKSAWAVLTQMGDVYGWFTLLGLALLLAHIYTRQKILIRLITSAEDGILSE